MADPQKIFEAKGQDWLKGKSAQYNLPVGGLFRQYKGIDPFEQSGMALPSLTGTTVTPTNAIQFLQSWNDGTTAYVYGQSNTKLYRYLKDSPYTETDVTSQITVGTTVVGSAVWKGRYIYAIRSGSNPAIRSNTL